MGWAVSAVSKRTRWEMAAGTESVIDWKKAPSASGTVELLMVGWSLTVGSLAVSSPESVGTLDIERPLGRSGRWMLAGAGRSKGSSVTPAL